MELYLIRHAEKFGDPHQTYTPPVKGCLSALGQQQAAALADSLAGVEFTAIYSSPLGRAIETAQSLAEPRSLAIVVEPWLTEWKPATICGTCDETQYEEILLRSSKLRPEESWKTAAGEGALEMAHRVIVGFQLMMASQGARPGHGGYLLDNPEDHRRIALVAHGGSLGCLAAFLLGIPIKPFAPVSFSQTGIAVFQLVHRVDVWYPTLLLPPPAYAQSSPS